MLRKPVSTWSAAPCPPGVVSCPRRRL